MNVNVMHALKVFHILGTGLIQRRISDVQALDSSSASKLCGRNLPLSMLKAQTEPQNNFQESNLIPKRHSFLYFCEHHLSSEMDLCFWGGWWDTLWKRTKRRVHSFGEFWYDQYLTFLFFAVKKVGKVQYVLPEAVSFSLYHSRKYED